MKSFIINAGRLGFVGYARLLLRYNSFYLLPGFCITSKKGLTVSLILNCSFWCLASVFVL